MPAPHLRAPGRPEHISPSLSLQRSGAGSSHWHPEFWVNNPVPASCGRCRHPLLPLQPGSAALEVQDSFCSDGSASCYISHQEIHSHLSSGSNFGHKKGKRVMVGRCNYEMMGQPVHRVMTDQRNKCAF